MKKLAINGTSAQRRPFSATTYWKHTGWCISEVKHTCFLYTVGQTIGHFWKRLASIIAVKGGHVKHLDTVSNMTALHCAIIAYIMLHVKEKW